MTRRQNGIALSLLVYLQVAVATTTFAADDKSQKTYNSGYDAKGTRETITGAIDTTKKPKPSKDFVITIDTSWAKGGFVLTKDGKGYMIVTAVHSDTGTVHYVATELVGYGTSNELWVYEAKDFKLSGKKVYHAFYMDQGDPVWSHVGNNPTNTSSFRAFAYGSDWGTKEP